MRTKLRPAVLLGLGASLLTALDVPKPAPDFPIPVPGGTIRTADFKGKVVVLEFLLTYCHTCQDSARVLSRLQSEYGARGFQVVGVAVDAGAEQKIAAFRQTTGANFPIGVRSEADARGYLEIPIVTRFQLPQILLIDRKGIIRVYHGGSGDPGFFAQEEKILRAEIEKLLGEKAPPAKSPARPAAKARKK